MRLFTYRALGNILRTLSDNCFTAARQQDEGKAVTACGMTDDDLQAVCEEVQWMLDGVRQKGQHHPTAPVVQGRRPRGNQRENRRPRRQLAQG